MSKILRNQIIYVLLAIIINLGFVSCNEHETQKIEILNFSKLDSIVIGSSNSSLSPGYQRNSKTILTKDSIYSIMDNGSIVENSSYPIKESDFDKILTLIQDSKIKNCKRVGKLCDGADILYLECYYNGEVFFKGHLELCDSKLGDLCGDLDSVREGVFKLLP